MEKRIEFVKISGRIADEPNLREAFISSLKIFTSTRQDVDFFIIPGGGKAVDALRHEHKKGSEVHWKAINIMDQNARLLEKELGSIENIHFPNVTRRLKEIPEDLPESWEITSDSITYWIAAHHVGTEQKDIILLKEIDGVMIPKEIKMTNWRRNIPLSADLIRFITIENVIPKPALSSYPFDTYLFKLVERFGHPFHVMNFRRINTNLNKLFDESSRMTSIIPGP